MMIVMHQSFKPEESTEVIWCMVTQDQFEYDTAPNRNTQSQQQQPVNHHQAVFQLMVLSS